MTFIYEICNNYGLTIIIFTFFTKVILFPINILVQKNSIKMVKMKPKLDELKIKYTGDKDSFMEAQIDLFEKEKYHPSLGVIPLLLQIPIILGLLKVVKEPMIFIKDIKDMSFLTIDLSAVPTLTTNFIIVILAVFSTVLLCYIENKINVLQKVQSMTNKILTNVLTIFLTVYFVFLVPAGVGLYWCFSNLFAILQMYLLNLFYPPEKYVDYEYINKIEKETKLLNEINKLKRKKSKYYYKKFFERDNIDNMRLLFYSEQSGFYKYFKGIIEYILDNSDIVIHYVTSDIDDQIFEMNNSRIIPYFIDTNQLIPLFMKLECDIVVMTTPDLQNMYLKKSLVRKDIEYIYTDHSINSGNMGYNTGALDNYDTIFITGYKQEEELLALEKLRNTKSKKYVRTGYCLFDQMIKDYNGVEEETILIAPSWQKDNIIDLCLYDLVNQLLKTKYKIILRPHPQFIKFNKDKVNEIENKYKDEINNNRFIIEKDFSSNNSIYNAKLLITDWSSISFEYAFTTLKPVLFIDTPMKIINKDYKKIDVIPIDIELRDIIGKSIKVEDIENINDSINYLIENKKNYEQINKDARIKYLYNFGESSSISGKYIVDQLYLGRGKNNE